MWWGMCWLFSAPGAVLRPNLLQGSAPMDLKLHRGQHAHQNHLQNQRDKLYACLPITTACPCYHYAFTQQRAVAAINSSHLFMGSSRWKNTVPPGHCLQCCQQRRAHHLNLPLRESCCPPNPLRSHTYTQVLLIVMYRCEGLCEQELQEPLCRWNMFGPICMHRTVQIL